MPGETPSQPGWYPDENGTMRWFDGASWTDHVQPGSGPAASDPAAPEPGGPEPTQQLPQQPGAPAGPPPPGGPPYGAVPPPSFQGGPGPAGAGGLPPSSAGGGKKGLLVALAVVGAVLLIAVLAVGAWAVFLRDGDDDSGSDDGGDSSALPDTDPEAVVEEYVQAVKDGDCETALDLLSEDLIAQEDANCDNPEDFMVGQDFDYEVGEATIDEEAMTATVPLQVSTEGSEEEVPVGLVVEGEEWKLDSFDVADMTDVPTDVPSDVPSDVPTDVPTDFTDVPTDFTDLPTELTDIPTDFPTDPSELESYLSDYFSEYLTFTG